MRKVKVHYPWDVSDKQESFFVPTLKLEQTKKEGLQSALHQGIIGKAEFGTSNGKLGVRFTRVR
jgi:hypothetical protein